MATLASKINAAEPRTAFYMSLGKTEDERRRKARLLRKQREDEAEKAARKRGIIGTRG